MFKINQISKFDDLLEKLSVSGHAIILNSQDKILLEAISKLFIMKLECKEQNSPCFCCNNCKKILDENAIDVEYYGKEKGIVVDDSKAIIESSYVLPLDCKNKYFVLHNFENATRQAQNKLLKMIEEPQSFDKYILLVQNLDAVLSTIKSRCQIFSLPRFNDEELKNVFDYSVGQAKKINNAVQFAAGNLTKLNEILNDEKFDEIYSLCLNIILNMQNSTSVLEYSSKIAKLKDKIEMILETLSSFYRDMICIKYGEEQLVQNKEILNQLKVLSNMTNQTALSAILKEIESVKQKFIFNSNFNGVIDNLLLKILEVKYLCK